MIASNKQIQEYNELTTIQRAQHNEAHERSKNLLFVRPQTQMQILTKMGKVVIKDYYHMIIMDEMRIG
jgi:hypothetical protein